MCTRIGTVVKQNAQDVGVFKLRCKSWSCPDCSRMRRRTLIREVKDGRPNRFITLTVNPNWFDSPEDRAARLAKAWRLVVAAYRHKFPTREAEYTAIFEATAKGEPHLHIAWRGGFVPQAWLAAQMRKRMGAPVVDVRKIHRANKVAEYVTKYISKRAIKFGTCKRYWRSKRYLAVSPRQSRRERNAGCRFYRSERHIVSYMRFVLSMGFTIHIERPDAFSFRLSTGMSSPPCWFEDEGALVEV